MRVICKEATGLGLSDRHLAAGYLKSTEFDLQTGNEYVVYGISVWRDILGYLVVGEGGYPHWYPADIFTIIRNGLPSSWCFMLFPEQEGYDLSIVLGYNELVNDDSHFDALSNLDPGALGIFQRRRRQIDSES